MARGWPKGKRRGPSPLAGKRVLALDPDYVDHILSDENEPPEVRFVAVMEALMEAMCNSSSDTTARVGTRLRTFWNTDMEETVIWTPVKGEPHARG